MNQIPLTGDSLQEPSVVLSTSSSVSETVLQSALPAKGVESSISGMQKRQTIPKRPLIQAEHAVAEHTECHHPMDDTPHDTLMQDPIGFFRCHACGSRHFELGLSPSGAGNIQVSITPERDVLIQTPKRIFQADLAFMQQFARCGGCHALQCWEYAP
ncbi:MAG: hypothetical protein ACKO37_04590 [Vampirovibrionales bacterium]